MERILHHFDTFDGFIGGTPYHGPAEMFHCPGCKYGHWFATGYGGWTWNGDRDKPTVNPSILNSSPAPRCHLFIRDGQIQFLNDCEHELAGKTVPMEPF